MVSLTRSELKGKLVPRKAISILNDDIDHIGSGREFLFPTITMVDSDTLKRKLLICKTISMIDDGISWVGVEKELLLNKIISMLNSGISQI